MRQEVRILTGVAAALAAILALAACTTEGTPVAEWSATRSARHWLRAVDADSLAIAYDEAGPILKERRTQADWIENVRDAKEVLGEVVDRDLVAHRYEEDPNRYSEGDYVIVTFIADYTRRIDVEELLVMQLTEGAWRPARYVIDPKP